MRLAKLSAAVALGLAASSVAVAASQSTNTDQQIAKLQQEIQQLQSQIHGMGNSNVGVSGHVAKLGSLYHRGGYLFISTDEDSPFDQLPSTSYALKLLQEKDLFANNKLVLGGFLQSDLQFWRGNYSQEINGFKYQNGSGIYLTTAKIYSMVNLNSWTTVLADLESDFTSSDSLKIDRAFITFGDLSKAPIYVTVGQLHLTNGVYSGDGPWSNSLLHTAFRPGTTPQLLLGYYENGLSTNFEVISKGNYRGSSPDYVMSFHYDKQLNKQWSYGFGAGFLNDIRGLGSSIGSAYTNNVMSGKTNGLWDVNGKITYQQFGLYGEYNQTTTGATHVKTGYNTGLMSAYVIAGTYTPTIWAKKMPIMVSYSRTHNMQNVPMGLSGRSVTSLSAPAGFKQEWIVATTREVMKNIYVGPEWAYQKLNNDQGHTWTATIDLSAYF